MPAYRFHILPLGGRPAEEDRIHACDDGEALDLGRMRLLMSPDVERITIRRPGMSPLVLTRDRAPAPGITPARRDPARPRAGDAASALHPDSRNV